MADLPRPVGVLQVARKRVDPHRGQRRVAVGVELTDGFLGSPSGGDLTVCVADLQQPVEPVLGVVVEPLLREGQQSADAVERIVLAAAVAEDLLLDAAADVVDLAGRELRPSAGDELRHPDVRRSGSRVARTLASEIGLCRSW